MKIFYTKHIAYNMYKTKFPIQVSLEKCKTIFIPKNVSSGFHISSHHMTTSHQL